MKIPFTLILCAILLAATAQAARADEVYKVRKGDSLSRIAKRFHVTTGSIAEANGLASDHLKPGTKLTIPGASPTSRSSSPKAAASRTLRYDKGLAEADSPRIETHVHTIEKGETLSSIAGQYGMTVKDVTKLNGFRRPGKLKAGGRILVRKPFDPAPAATASPSKPPPVSDDGEIARKLRELGEFPVLADFKEFSGSGARKGSDLKAKLLEIAHEMLDIPYRFGGTSLFGIDCSGYVQKVFSVLNIVLPRTAREQFNLGKLVGRDELSIGDLVFFRTYARFPSHVGIYVGDNRFIHASSEDRKVTIDSLDAPYYLKRFIGARRLDLGDRSDEI